MFYKGALKSTILGLRITIELEDFFDRY